VHQLTSFDFAHTTTKYTNDSARPILHSSFSESIIRERKAKCLRFIVPGKSLKGTHKMSDKKIQDHIPIESKDLEDREQGYNSGTQGPLSFIGDPIGLFTLFSSLFNYLSKISFFLISNSPCLLCTFFSRSFSPLDFPYYFGETNVPQRQCVKHHTPSYWRHY